MQERKPIVVLMADDDPDDRLLARDAFEESRVTNELRFVEDGVQLLQYLRKEGPYAENGAAPQPGVILLDLNMPKKDGRTALQELKADDRLKHIPVIVLTTSKAEEDILRSYQLGVSGFITKPVTFEKLVDVVRSLSQYWLELVELPRDQNTSQEN